MPPAAPSPVGKHRSCTKTMRPTAGGAGFHLVGGRSTSRRLSSSCLAPCTPFWAQPRGQLCSSCSSPLAAPAAGPVPALAALLGTLAHGPGQLLCASLLCLVSWQLWGSGSLCQLGWVRWPLPRTAAPKPQSGCSAMPANSTQTDQPASYSTYQQTHMVSKVLAADRQLQAWHKHELQAASRD